MFPLIVIGLILVGAAAASKKSAPAASPSPTPSGTPAGLPPIPGELPGVPSGLPATLPSCDLSNVPEPFKSQAEQVIAQVRANPQAAGAAATALQTISQGMQMAGYSKEALCLSGLISAANQNASKLGASELQFASSPLPDDGPIPLNFANTLSLPGSK